MTKSYMKEDQICKSFYSLFMGYKSANQLQVDDIKLFHIPNGGKRNVIEASKFKQMGTLPGVPDYQVIWVKSGKVFFGFLEAKREKASYLSSAQKNFKVFCDDNNVYYNIFRSPDEGVERLKGWGIL